AKVRAKTTNPIVKAPRNRWIRSAMMNMRARRTFFSMRTKETYVRLRITATPPTIPSNAASRINWYRSIGVPGARGTVQSWVSCDIVVVQNVRFWNREDARAPERAPTLDRAFDDRRDTHAES